MNTATNTILIDNYFGLLNSLSRGNKIKLIAKLSNFIVDEVAIDENVVERFFKLLKQIKVPMKL
jgi:hypothetical protein